MLKPTRKLDRPRLLQELQKAGIKEAVRLCELLTRVMPQQFKKARKALFEAGPVHYWPYETYAVCLSGADGMQTALTEFIDQCLQDNANNGEPDDDLFVQRIDVPDEKNPRGYRDGLATLAQIFNAWTCLDEVLSLLMDFKEQSS